jgi:hypothetical protein
MAQARKCLRAYLYRYQYALVGQADRPALRFGSAMHLGVETWRRTHDPEQVFAAIDEACTGWEDRHQVATAVALLDGYMRVWHDDPVFDSVEMQWHMPLIHPGGRTSTRHELAGKIDGFHDGWVWETKTAGEDISPASQYWLRLRLDPQVTMYLNALADLNPRGIMYDVIRKPTISPGEIPQTDDDGLKIVVERESGLRAMNKNGAPKQSVADRETQYLLTRPETPEEWGLRLADDIARRPEHYFARREVVRLDDDIKAFKRDISQWSQIIAHCERSNHWPRNVGRFSCSYCDYADLCLNGVQVDLENPPAGYTVEDTAFGELDS